MLFRSRFAFVARIAGTYGVFIETHPLSKGRREIGSFGVPETKFPDLLSERRRLGVRIEGEPPVEPSEWDLIGLANGNWGYTGLGIRGNPEVELDRTLEWEKWHFDRIFLFREHREGIDWWPFRGDATDVVLQYDDAVRETKPRSIREYWKDDPEFLEVWNKSQPLPTPNADRQHDNRRTRHPTE